MYLTSILVFASPSLPKLRGACAWLGGTPCCGDSSDQSLVLTPARYNEADTVPNGVIVNPGEMETLQHDHDDCVDIVNGLPLMYTALSILRHSYQSN